jgi:SagB-type dehydrogenase family enzyme
MISPSEFQALMSQRGDTIPELIKDRPVNWSDSPSRHSVRPGGFEVRLTRGFAEADRAAAEQGRHFDRLTFILAKSAALRRRKMNIDWTRDVDSIVDGPVQYTRGTASGGGLYPIEIYLVATGIAGVPHGVYHYSEARSALVRLRQGDHGDAIRRSLDDTEARHFYIVLTARFWKNAFKYKNFSYQVVTEDHGAFIESLLSAGAQAALPMRVRHLFNDALIDRQIGLDVTREVCMSVIEPTEHDIAPRHAISPSMGAFTTVMPPRERSRHVEIPSVLWDVHRATVSARPVPPSAWNMAPAARHHPSAPMVELPPAGPDSAGNGLDPSLRESSYGRFDARKPLNLDQIAALLRAAMKAYASDVYATAGAPHSVMITLFAARVAGLQRGVYGYDQPTDTLVWLGDGGEDCRSEQLQKLYYLKNQNIASAAAIFGFVGRQQDGRQVWGDRSIRIVNAEAGMMAQRIYVTAGRLGIGCSAALGFNTQCADRIFQARPGAESTVLLMFFGTKLAQAAAFEFSWSA